MPDNNFVVYAYVRSGPDRFGRVGTFYYIGKGNLKRPYKCGKGNRRVNCPRDRKNNIIILHKNLKEETAFDYEKKLIEFYGRIGTTDFGILRNSTDGGEGASGAYQSSADWWHPLHGEFLQKSCTEIAKTSKDKGTILSGLSQVINGKSFSYKGWRLLKNKPKSMPIQYVRIDWYHKDFGYQYSKTCKEIRAMDTRLKTYSELYCVVLKEHVEAWGWCRADRIPVHYVKHNWFNEKFGQIYNKTASEIMDIAKDPNLRIERLHRIIAGNVETTLGWCSLENIPIKFKKCDWYHPDFGILVGKTSLEILEISGENFRVSRLYDVINKKSNGYKKWCRADSKPRRHWKFNWYHPVHGKILQKTAHQVNVTYNITDRLDYLHDVTTGVRLSYLGWTVFK